MGSPSRPLAVTTACLLAASAAPAAASAPAQQVLGYRRPEVRFATPGQSVAEGARAVAVEVRIDTLFALPVTVPYELLGDATLGEDYLIDPPSPLVFQPRQRSVVLTVTPLDDGALEPDELLRLRLLAPDRATLGVPGEHELWILDDDGLPLEDFNRCEGLVAPWTFEDPLGDGAARVTGVGTQDAWLELTVPAGSDHLPQPGSPGARARRPLQGADPAFACRIDSELAGAGRHQGVLVEGDGGAWLLFELRWSASGGAGGSGGPSVALLASSGGSTLPLFDATIAASAPYYLAGRRAGDAWTFAWSDDGALWNELPSQEFALDPVAVALLAGNSGGAAAPAHTAAFDWIVDPEHLPLADDGPFPDAGPFTLSTGVDGAGQVLVDPSQRSYGCTDVVTLTAVPEAGWLFDSWQGDLSGTENPRALTLAADASVVARFTSDTTPPAIGEVSVAAGPRSALVSWTTDEPARATVEWGPDAGYGQSVSDETLATSHALLLEGLVPAQTWHFRVLATDAADNQSATEDATFATAAGSDDFNHCAGLSAAWSFVDPVGDAGATVLGVGTQDAVVRLSVPGGSNHVAFGPWLPARIVQPIADADFQATVKLDSPLVAATQIQGLLVEQDGQNWLRFDLYRHASGVRAFLGRTQDGSTATVVDKAFPLGAPMYLRVTRSGDLWSFDASQDPQQGWGVVGATSFAIAPVQIGLYAGNAGGAGAPPHAADFDWFEISGDPILVEDGPFPGSGPFALSTSAVGAGQVLADPDQPEYTCSDVVTLEAISAPGWLFDSWQGDLGGSANPQQLAMDADRDVTAVFVADGTPPVVSQVAVTAHRTGATVTWLTDEPATSTVEYGPDAGYGSSASDGALVLFHSVQLSGLAPGTTYHFRVCSTDFALNTACSVDGTFATTLASGLVSDDFNACEGLRAPWTWIDPIGDASQRVVGVGTEDAWLELAVPAGSTHVPFHTVLPARVVQPANDVDLGFEVKLDSALSATTQLQGVTIEQDPVNWIRFDLYRGAGGTAAFVGNTVSGATSTVANLPLALTPPMHLRVQRAGDLWTFEASDDPELAGWTTVAQLPRALALDRIGLYAGNASGAAAPAHVARFDSFVALDDPLAVEDGPFPGSGPYTLTVGVSGAGTVLRSPEGPQYHCTDLVQLEAVADPGWDFVLWQGDLAGSDAHADLAMSQDRDVEALFSPDVVPPIVSQVAVTAGTRSALVTWLTDEPATSRVDFGTTSAHGSYVEEGALVTSHSIELSGLEPQTLYSFQVRSVDDGGLVGVAPEETFETEPEWTGVSDDFNQCGGLLGVWTFYDPVGDAPAPFVQGVGTDDAQLVLAVPGGSDHEAYGTIHAPHLMQAVNDVDFELEVKFDTLPTLAYQIQGLLVKQDALRWLRFDLYSNGSQVRLFAGTTSGGVTSTLADATVGSPGGPVWLRLARQGNAWSLRWSGDGVGWTSVLSGAVQALQVAEVGLYVGNAIGASSPAHSVAVDYFFDVLDPLVPEDGPFEGGGPFTLSTAVVPAGSGVVVADPLQQDYTCSDVVTLLAQPAPGWRFTGWSGDLGTSANPQALPMIADRDVSAHFEPDLDPPVISNVFVSVTQTTATVSWETDEPADSRVEYGESLPYTHEVFDAAHVLQHSVLLTGLTGETEYHFRVHSADPGGLVTSTADMTFTTGGAGNVTSDDFNHPNLDRGLWSWVDPLAGSGLRFEERAKLRLVGAGTADARLEIEIPAGTEYLPWIEDGSARVLQQVEDDDLELELKIESVLSQKYQSVGVVVEGDADTWMRFDFQHTGSALRVLRASFDGGVATNLVTTTVQSGAWLGEPLYMRVKRAGDLWTHSFSLDGSVWTSNGSSFAFPMEVERVGPMAGNEGPHPAAVLARIDYFFSTQTPIVPEDFGAPADAISPYLYLARGREVSDSAVRVQWATDERATSILAWGLAAGVYDQGQIAGDAGVHADGVLVEGLLPSTTYHFRVSSADAAGNPIAHSSDIAVTTAPAGQDGRPVIELWYGQPDGRGEIVQSFGRPGTGQTWVNVLGNVQDPIGDLASLSYRLNGGPPQPLSIGQGGFTLPYRLVGAGDFNAEIAASALLDDSVGLNELLLTAVDEDGHVTEARVWIDYDADGVWPRDYSVDWSTVGDLQQAIQIVDGEWEIDPDSGVGGTPALRNSRGGVAVHGYDRLFLVGDAGWDDFEFVFEVTVHALNPAGFYPDSNSHAIGVIMRWPGHSGGSQQPRQNFFPLGGLFAYRWYQPGVNENWQAYSTNFNPKIDFADFYRQVEIGESYVFRGRCETLANGQSLYSMKSWEVGTPEPGDWLGQMITPAGNLGAGSLLVLSHEVDASFGNLTVTPLD